MKKSFMTAVLAGAALLCACGGNDQGLRMGSLSSFDSLSYAMGANVGYGMSREMNDIPFDYDLLAKGVKEGALDKADITPEEAENILRDFFMNKRIERAGAIAAKRAVQAEMERDTTGTVVDSLPEVSMFDDAKECKRISYAFGADMGMNLRKMGWPFQIVWINKAMEEVREGKARMELQQSVAFLNNYYRVEFPKLKKAESDEWLASIEKQSGVKKTESGLLYRIDREGDAAVKATDDRDGVRVMYEGKLRTGEVFDSSYERQDTISFALNGVIKGWTEGMKLVGKGGKITLWIPSELAYGERGAGRMIGPNEALEFSVELFDVMPYTAPAESESETKKAE